jgi:hypothetical protein
LDKELQTLEELNKALKDLSLGGSEHIDIFGSMPQSYSQVEDDSGGDSHDKRYTEVSMDILSQTTPGRNKLTGNYYYAYGVVVALFGTVEDFDAIEIYLDYEENVKYETMAIGVDRVKEGWSDIELSQLIKVYFRYVGYSSEHGQQYGIYDYHEIYDPFVR